MAGYRRFGELMLSWTETIYRPEGTLRETLSSNERRFYSEVFFGFIEIVNTMEALDLALVLVSRMPPRSKQIKREVYLRYQVQAYLQEVYILKERLTAYATIIQRRYKRLKNDKEIDFRFKPLFEFLHTSLNGLVNTRGSHVHSRRFSNSILDSLEEFTFLSRFKSEFTSDAKVLYLNAKNYWRTQIKENNKATNALLDEFFDFLYEEMTIDGKLIKPA